MSSSVPSVPLSSYVVKEYGFTLIDWKRIPSIDCRVVTCEHYEMCMNVGKKAGILPKAKSIFEALGLDWQLPSHGKPYDDCGSWRYRGCLNAQGHEGLDLEGHTIEGKAYVEWYRRSCFRAECPVCYEKWAGKEAGKIAHRLRFFWKYGKVIHVSVSPLEKDVLNLHYEKLRQKAYRIAKNRGIIGGSLIWHPFREANNGTWYFSPHFHILGFGWVKNTLEGFNRDGWVVKNILDGKEERSVFRTAMYQLSHCGLDVHRKFRPVSWFGCCSTAGKNNVKVPPIEKEKHLCPCCGEELVQLRYFGDPDDLPDKEEGGHAWLDSEFWQEKAFDYG